MSIEDFIAKSVPGILIGGFVGGVLYGIKEFISFDEKCMKTLSFMPEAFDMDKVIAENFVRLQQFRAFSPTQFDESGIQVDKLLILKKSLVRGDFLPNMFSGVDGLRYLRAAEVSLRLFLRKLKTRVKTTEQFKYAEQSVKIIIQNMNAHVISIRGMYVLADKRSQPYSQRPQMSHFPHNQTSTRIATTYASDQNT